MTKPLSSPVVPTSFRLSREAYILMRALIKRTGLKRGAVLELALRRLAREQGVKL